jgi:hypothetical protein
MCIHVADSHVLECPRRSRLLERCYTHLGLWFLLLCLLCIFVTTKPERHQHHHPMGQAERHPSLRYCVLCILEQRNRNGTNTTTRWARRVGTLPYVILLGTMVSRPLTTTCLRGLDNPSRPRPRCSLACRCGKGPTQGTCKRELTAEKLLPSIRMRVRIFVCRL